ncbi:AMP-binding protein [Thermoflavimicrobium dichotomicum]|uniref:Crotonobetaine/carnitine-CoA ligase n=1 Tax=Thermoflavimicrobium dichotomicum TaxID=46223 RepID=A0A1I3TAJ7_9BACL|nr:AMP-binding protein [Thermoflavimicrobium dichotomicum]SFJ66686.1 crotonobetaine/carnitine-CoA ligase [Thermoflavimicrobium dichotomicum]
MDVIGNRTLRDLLTEKVTIHPDKTFLVFEDNKEQRFTLTYREFSEKVNRLAAALLEFGVKKEDKVTLHLPNCLEFMISWFALAHIGAVMVPTNILSTEDEMEYILGHSESILLITEEIYLKKFNNIKDKLPLRDIWLARYEGTEYQDKSLDRIIEQSKGEVPFVPLHSEDVAAMMYTSGTTSRPKGVLITHANYLYAGEVMSKSIRLTPDDRPFIVLPLFHANAQYYSTMSALTVGASIAMTERFSASRYFKQAKRLGATVGSLFAAPIRMILRQKYDPADRDHNLRVVWFAQTVTEEQLETFEKNYNTKLLQLYGMTETIGTPLMNPIDGVRKNMGIGKPVLGYEVKVVDDFGNEVPQGEVGELIVKGVPGRTLMKGYFNNQQATEEALKEGWLYTGDNVRMDEEGYFFFVDRKKDMIKRAGENVAANEIEKVITQHPGVFDCAVIGIPDEIRDESIKAYVVLREGHQVSPDEIISFCQTRLAKFKVPEYVEFVTELPRTSVGKIQKHILRKMHQEGAKIHG